MRATHIAQDKGQHNVEEQDLSHEPEVQDRDRVNTVGFLGLEVGDLRPRQNNHIVNNHADQTHNRTAFLFEAAQAHRL